MRASAPTPNHYARAGRHGIDDVEVAQAGHPNPLRRDEPRLKLATAGKCGGHPDDAAVLGTVGGVGGLGAWRAISAITGSLVGIFPHVLHHAGLIVGAAVLTGARGNLLFGVLVLAFSMPLLRRLYVRFSTWRAPAVVLAILVAMFSVSAFVIGPAISGEAPVNRTPVKTPDHSEYEGHRSSGGER